MNSLNWLVHEARLNNSLHKIKNDAANGSVHGNTPGSLFSLYLAMQLPNTANDIPYEFDANVQNPSLEHVLELPSAPKSPLYASESDYSRHLLYIERLQSAINSSNNHSISSDIHWQNSFFPQALHHAAEQILIDDEVKHNMPYQTQLLHQTAPQEEAANTSKTQEPLNETDLFSVIQDAENFFS
ncbi:hypothetical protein ACOI22_01710 [Glaciecola sp. 2405UD65-10]|uniref:hypothetical protein n=1 Tax=Glaciecola sp. 2405UD65-10 TaxID=3397244 RepID=UPI003B595C46